MKVALLPLAIALCVVSTASFGQTLSTGTVSTGKGATEDPNINLSGDTFKLKSNLEFSRPSGSETATGIAPKDSCFRVTREEDVEIADPSDTTKKITVKRARGTFRTGFHGLYGCPDSVSGVNDTDPWDIRSKTLVEADAIRFGWTYGVLVAPFKYYWSEQSFTTGASVGPYLGYRLYDRPGSSTVLAGAIGAATATIKTQNPDGTSTETQKNGLTFALAYLFNIKNDFNVGFIGGWDVFSKSDDVSTSGKLWLSVSFGKKID